MNEIPMVLRELTPQIQTPIPHRDFSHERVISSVPDARAALYRVVAGVVIVTGFLAPILVHGEMVIRLFIGAILVIVGGAYSLAIPRFFRDDVDEVRAGHDYLVVKRSGQSATVPIAQVKRVRHLRFMFMGDHRVELLLRARTHFGQRVTLLPDNLGWRSTWGSKPDTARRLVQLYYDDSASLPDELGGRY